ncbi:MAG TPA: histidine kinase dimerization/phospho-acceptor domain-containing protein, partial [Kofleriaceae bacterium]|nr:histidine kinase dimerization/phospho-acceptor domain-containing protein [Kofleriaceae bacterium]
MTAEARASRDSALELREKKRVLAALVVHDLRSPLSAVGGCLELLRSELGDDTNERVRGYLDDAETLLKKALGLVATILDVDELEDGILHAYRTPLRIIELIERARAGNRAHEEMRQLTIEVDVDPDLVVRLDKDLFARVIENLLENGMRYAPRGGTCAVTARLDGDWLELAIGN